MIKKLLSIALIAGAVSFTNAQSFNLLFPFTSCTNGTPGAPGVDPTPTPTATGISAGSFTALGVATGTYANQAAGVFNWGGFTTGYPAAPQDSYAAMTGSISLTRYYGVTIATSPNYVMTLNSMSFQSSRSTNGPRCWAVRSSQDGFTNNLTGSYVPLGPAITSTNAPVISILTGTAANTFFWNKGAIASSTATPEAFASNNICNITLGGGNFTNVIGTVTLGIFPWNAVGASFTSSGTFRIDSVNISGTATFSLGVGLPTITHDLNAKIKLYPNPSADGVVTVDAASTNYTKIEVINVLGAVVASQNNTTTEEKIRLDLATLPAGTYFVKVTTGDKYYTEKLIISK